MTTGTDTIAALKVQNQTLLQENKKLSEMAMKVQSLLGIIREQEATISTLNDTIGKLQALLEESRTLSNKLQAQVAWLNRQYFGRKSEKMPSIDPCQPNLFDGVLPEEAPEVIQEAEKAAEKIETETAVQTRKRERRVREMTRDLPVLEREIIEPEGIDKTLYRPIGEEVTRVVECKPGMLYVKEYVRVKYALRDSTALPPEGHGTIEIAPMPLLPIPKGLPGASLLAEILLKKYEYHMPFYRIAAEFGHKGLRVAKSTIDGWFKPAVNLLRPLHRLLAEEIMSCDYIQADETTVPVIDKAGHKAAKEYIWLVRDVVHRLELFHYDKGSRAGSVIAKLAEGFSGYVQCDGFAGYETAFRANPGVRLVGCMAHIRRYFEQALDENREAASHVIGQLQLLSRVESGCDAKGLSPQERQRVRQELSRPIMDGLKLWMETEGIKFSGNSLMGKAVGYAYNRWDKMERYLEDGRLRIDNNLAENAIRPLVLGRKNYLFCGDHEAAECMSVVRSLLSTCRCHSVNPRDYLIDIISKMPAMEKATREELLELLPHRWILSHPSSVLTQSK